ncbi:MAG: NADH-quinone oxidoreductase subunit NuoG [Acidimicrobiales bacterium]
MPEPSQSTHRDPSPEEPPETVTFTLDGRQVTAEKGEMLIAAAERAGTFIPRFCYHPRMKSVGVCRMCLVEVGGPRGPSLQPSCFVEVQDGAEVVTNSDKVKKAQDGVLEFLLVNHPLDCPVCDKGGECPLQDQTLAYGPGETRFVEEKRHFEKPIPISELVLLDRERCIQCSRCTRFAAEVAGEAQIDFIGRGELIEVNTFPDLPFTSYFSGNTVQICPVGALTATPYRFTARPWDLEQVESTCTNCSVGCRVAVQSSANRVTRLLGIDVDPVNHGWLCDKGRFAYEAVNGTDRLTDPLVRKDGDLVPVSWHEALDAVARALEASRSTHGSGSIGMIGGGRLTNEGAYAWAKLAKGIIGTDSVDVQLGDGLPANVVLGLPTATIDQAASADTVIVLAGDLREEVPVLFLRLRGATADGGPSIVELAPHSTALTPYAAASLRYQPGEASALVGALTAPDSEAPAGVSKESWQRSRDLVGADNVVVVVGRPSLAEDGALVADAAQLLASGLPGARFLPVLRRGNVRGALDMGLAPGLLPGRVTLEAGRAHFVEHWGSVPDEEGRDTAAMLAAAAAAADSGSQPLDTLIVLGADPLSDFPDRRLARRGLDAAGFVVAVASAPGEVVERADVVLPAAEAHERPGTTTNIEGRLSRLGQKLVPPGQAWPDWMIAAELAAHLGEDMGLDSVADVWDEIERVAPAYRGITRQVLESPTATDGVLVPLPSAGADLPQRRAAPFDPIAFPGVESVEHQGAPPRAGLVEMPTAAQGAEDETGRLAAGDGSGRAPVLLAGPVEIAVPHVAPNDRYSFRLVATRRLYDRGSAVSRVPALGALVQPAPLRVNPHDLDALGVTSGASVRLRTATASAVLEVIPDPSLPRQVAAVDFNVELAEGTAADLIDVSHPVVEFRLETL